MGDYRPVIDFQRGALLMRARMTFVMGKGGWFIRDLVVKDWDQLCDDIEWYRAKVPYLIGKPRIAILS